MSVCPIGLAIVLVACGTPEGRQSGPLNSVSAVLERYQQALGGADAIRRVQSEVVYGEIETSLKPGAKSKFVYYARPSKMLMKVARPDGREVVSGFDGYTSWAVAPEGASVDREVALDSMRRDADLQFPLHEQDYFKKLEFAGIADFNGRQCYWLRGTTTWGKESNQYYDVKTGLLAGYRFQPAGTSNQTTTEVFGDYKSFDGFTVAMRRTSITGDRSETFTLTSVSFDPLSDSIFEMPGAVKTLVRRGL